MRRRTWDILSAKARRLNLETNLMNNREETVNKILKAVENGPWTWRKDSRGYCDGTLILREEEDGIPDLFYITEEPLLFLEGSEHFFVHVAWARYKSKVKEKADAVLIEKINKAYS